MSGYQASKRVTIIISYGFRQIFFIKTSSFANESNNSLEESTIETTALESIEANVW